MHKSIAKRLHIEGTEMLYSMEQSIMDFRSQSEMALSTHASLQITNQSAVTELRASNSELEPLRKQFDLNQM